MSSANLIPRGHLQQGELLDLLTKARAAHLYGTINLGNDVALTFVDGRIVATPEAGESTKGMGRQRTATLLADLTESYNGWYWIGPIVDTPDAHELPAYQPVALLRQVESDQPAATRSEDRTTPRPSPAPEPAPEVPSTTPQPASIQVPPPVVPPSVAPAAPDHTDPDTDPDPDPDDSRTGRTPGKVDGTHATKQSTVEEMRRRRSELRFRGQQRRRDDRPTSSLSNETASAIQRLVAAAPDLEDLQDLEPFVPPTVADGGEEPAPEPTGQHAAPATAPGPRAVPPHPAPPHPAPPHPVPPHPAPPHPASAGAPSDADRDDTAETGDAEPEVPTRKTALRKLIRSLVN